MSSIKTDSLPVDKSSIPSVPIDPERMSLARIYIVSVVLIVFESVDLIQPRPLDNNYQNQGVNIQIVSLFSK